MLRPGAILMQLEMLGVPYVLPDDLVEKRVAQATLFAPLAQVVNEIR